MDFENLRADVNRILTKHYTPGRGGRRIDKVVVHYNAANLSIEGCYSVWQSREASAHYQVEEGGRIGQLVHDWDTAWHAGNFSVNQSSIGIEHANRPDGTISPACLDAGAHLVAALCKNYSLGRPEWGKNVFPHKHFAATSCPGQIYGSQKDEYIRRAQYWYGVMMGETNPKPQPKPEKPKPKEEIVTNEDIEKIAHRVWDIQTGKETADRCYRMTSMLKGLCGISAEDTSDPINGVDDITKWTMDRWERCTAMLKALCGIDPDDTESRPATPACVTLSEEQMQAIAEMVVDMLAKQPTPLNK
ncbi:MAG: peptidoglycan recognition family protein [Coriobacteriaceae bacterium]|nr:peptidoglycan recognition family protein [Coriobacteriaceae bacterium]